MNTKRIKFFFITYTFLFTSIFSYGSSKWTDLTSYTLKVQLIRQKENSVFVVTDGKLFSYNNNDNSFETYIKPNGGNFDITQLEYSDKNKCFVLTRSDGNIEIVHDNKTYNNIPFLKTTTQNLDKKINSIYITDNDAYISTNFGFIVINIPKMEIKESGIFNIPFYSITSLNEKLYATTAQGVYSVDKKENLIDFSNWEKTEISNYYDGSTPFEDNELILVRTYNEKLVFLAPNKAVYYMPTETSVETLVSNNDLEKIEVMGNGHLFVSGKNTLWDYKDLSNFSKTNINDLNAIIANGNKDNEYWMSSEGNNLSLIKTNTSNGYDFIEDKRWLKPNGPASNLPFSLVYDNDQLIITGGGYTNINTTKSSIGANFSILKNSRWTNVFSGEINEQTGKDIQDFVYAISEPSNPNHIFASSWSDGLFEFQGSELINLYDSKNSVIEELIDNSGEDDEYRTTRVGRSVYDNKNNLWILNSRANDIVKIYTKDSRLISINYPDISDKNIQTNARTIIIDKYNKKWISSIGGGNPYIFIIDDNGNPENSSAHKTKFINSFKDSNGNTLNINGIYSLTEDNQGNMWIGTDIGPFTLKYNNILSNQNIYLNKVLVSKEEGSNIVVPLLENIQINTIAVDGANRKWIGTETSGLYLIDSDNKELKHFTTENSPLPSNNILSLAIDNKTGTLYVGSERGLLSYTTSATTGATSFSNVYAYPNPVNPDYYGEISITGLKENSTVKITDVKGNLINQGKSLGGQYTWNGNNTRGRRVDTGVYIVFGSSSDGTEGVVTKIMFIN